MILTLKSCFSAVSTAIAASEGAFFSISQTAHAEHKQSVLARRKYCRTSALSLKKLVLYDAYFESFYNKEMT